MICGAAHFCNLQGRWKERQTSIAWQQLLHLRQILSVYRCSAQSWANNAEPFLF